MITSFTIVTALIINTAVGYTAYRLKAVTVSGAAAGMILGAVIFISGGLPFWCVLFTFFTSSSILSVFKKRNKLKAERMYEKTGARDWTQVFANGGISMICAVGWAVTASPVFAAGFAASLASANADTWASEIGPLSKRNPVLITTFQPVQKGRSGAISLLGTSAAFAGALLIGIVFFISIHIGHIALNKLIIVSATAVIGGFIGSLVDSFLGATLQAQYLCTETNTLTEKKFCDGIPAELVRGLRAINNDAVNALSSLAAASLPLIVFIR